MKKFLLGLLAIAGMALCFTSCGNNNPADDETTKSEATKSGESLYQSVIDYQAADANTTDGQVAKLTAAAKLYSSYQDYKTNSEDKEWVKDFATGAVSTLAETKKEEAKTQLLEKLADGSLISEDTSEKVVAVANLASQLGSIFSAAK
ncbi:MAG: hypothetical protein MJ198_08220 [Bacteroidales bacterium]|nr:hypothetical protein [Bacteroidales bacterium]